MGMSIDHTVSVVWAEARRGANLLTVPITAFDRFTKVNRAQNEVAAQIYPAVVNSYLTSAQPTVTSNAISIATTRIERSALSRLTLSSSAITNANIRIVSPEEFYAFRSGAQHNYGEIIATVIGSSILLAKGSGVAEYGTVTMVYPRFPTQVTQDSDTLDLPDGAACQMAILRLQKILSEQYQTPPQDTREQNLILLRQLFDSVGFTISTQELQEKAAALS